MSGSQPVSHRVAVVGAGWAGLAAACEAARRGAAVTLYEAAAQPGGRARTVSWQLPGETLAVDNGQHLLVGAYRSTMRLIAELGGDPERLFERVPLTFNTPDGTLLRAARLPAPWHLAVGLIRARRLPMRTRFDCLWLIAWLRQRRWRVDARLTVEQLLDRARQSQASRELLWRPLCVAALNTRSDEASARVFAVVLRDTLGAQAEDSDFLVPRVPLGELLPRLAIDFLAQGHARLRWRTPVRSLVRDGSGFLLGSPDGQARFDAAVLAVPPRRALALLRGIRGDTAPPDAFTGDFAFEYRPITTVYLRWRSTVPTSLPAIALLQPDDARDHHGQWLFVHRRSGEGCLAAVVISADGPHRALARERLAAACESQLRELYALPAADATLVLDEKRATFACTPGLRRPPTDALAALAPGIWLAGDYVDSEYPATLEGAVRSGLAAGGAAAGTTAGAAAQAQD